MGIYIPGIETPKGHNYVTITIWSSGIAGYGLFDREENLHDYKAIKTVPVPPHGRLIDADVLLEWANADLRFGDPDFHAGLWHAVSAIKDAPTIIPAEEATQKDGGPDEAPDGPYDLLYEEGGPDA